MCHKRIGNPCGGTWIAIGNPLRSIADRNHVPPPVGSRAMRESRRSVCPPPQPLMKRRWASRNDLVAAPDPKRRLSPCTGKPIRGDGSPPTPPLSSLTGKHTRWGSRLHPNPVARLPAHVPSVSPVAPPPTPAPSAPHSATADSPPHEARPKGAFIKAALLLHLSAANLPGRRRRRRRPSGGGGPTRSIRRRRAGPGRPGPAGPGGVRRRGAGSCGRGSWTCRPRRRASTPPSPPAAAQTPAAAPPTHSRAALRMSFLPARPRSAHWGAAHRRSHGALSLIP